MYGDARIEDLWRDFFCVSTNLTAAKLRVARDGPMWRCVRASCSAPGMAPPIVDDGQLMIDGGILDNLPVQAMRQTPGVGTIIASDAGATVGVGRERSLARFGPDEACSGLHTDSCGCARDVRDPATARAPIGVGGVEPNLPAGGRRA